uniref:Transmembrane protein n=1 Tax=Lotus japonicus TaxID=34305 RepID=I3S6P8_LOTJA|nr:unknown [Lotus japonicus]
MNPIGFSFIFLFSLALVSYVSAQERAPHGLVYQNPEAISPSAYDFFHPNARKPETKQDPCDASKCSPLLLAAQVEATQIHESNQVSSSHKGRKHAGGVAGIVFGVTIFIIRNKI